MSVHTSDFNVVEIISLIHIDINSKRIFKYISKRQEE